MTQTETENDIRPSPAHYQWNGAGMCDGDDDDPQDPAQAPG